jgi:hypothetical protein
MRKALVTLLTAATLVTVASAMPVVAGTGATGQLDAFGLTQDGRLIGFAVKHPENAKTVGQISGLVMDTKVVGIDFRPANGFLYALGDASGVYTLDPGTAQATLVSRLNVALAGTSFGVDFNPTVDRLRVISDTGQNLRVNVDTGATLVDGTLNYVGPPVITAVGVTAAAYTNNDADPNTATTLFDIDTTLDQVVVQAPPNAGSLNPTGKLGVDASSAAGFDIHSVIEDGTTAAALAFATLDVGGGDAVYRIDLFTGAARVLGTFDHANDVIDLAVTLDS